MGGCIAIKCNNSDKKGFRMFNYPTNKERRKKWLLNTRRDKFDRKKKQIYRKTKIYISRYQYDEQLIFILII